MFILNFAPSKVRAVKGLKTKCKGLSDLVFTHNNNAFITT